MAQRFDATAYMRWRFPFSGPRAASSAAGLRKSTKKQKKNRISVITENNRWPQPSDLLTRSGNPVRRPWRGFDPGDISI
jgi:hypothetical protein